MRRSVMTPLMARTAGDLMTEVLVTIPQDMSLQAAAHRLALHQISGAPVVNDDGVCVGVLSATDFVHLVEQGRRGALRGCAAGNDYTRAWQLTGPEDFPDETVAEH